MAIAEENKVPLNTDTERALRQIVSAWSNGIPYHTHTNLGEKIDITEINYLPVYNVNIKTQFYSRQDEAKERPYGNGLIYTDKLNASRTGYQRKSFVKHIDTYCLPKSESVETCGTCYGKGRTSCGTCSGRGNVSCGSCGGNGSCSQCWGTGKQKCHNCTGGKTTCGSCGGSGSRNEYDPNTKSYVYQRCFSCSGTGGHPCQSCGGAGQKNCSACGGSSNCNRCYGSGRLRCNTCGGIGQVTCSRCNGNGQVITYLERTEKWDYGNLGDVVLAALLRTSFKTLLIKENASRERVFEKSSVRFDNSLFSAEPQHFQSTYNGLLKKSFSPAALNVHTNPTILEQYVQVNRLPAYLVNYVYEKVNYCLLVFFKDKSVFEEDGPITKSRKELIENAHKYFKRKNFGKSADYADKAVKMGLDLSDPLLEKINKKVTQKIKASYRIGAFIGAWFSSYCIGLWILSYFKNPMYMLDVLNKQVYNWGNNFIVINNAFLILLILIISLSRCIRLAGLTMFPFPGKAIKPEAARVIIGVCTSIFVTAFVACVILLLNLTGLFLPVTKLIQFAVEAILPYLPLNLLKNLFQ